MIENKILETKEFKQRLQNIERVCELSCPDNKLYLKKAKEYFHRSTIEYYMLQGEALVMGKTVVERAYHETLGYLEQTRCDKYE